jgi:hypothetical protein
VEGDVFVPFCCEVLSNLRKYSRDENATLLAEREGYYGVIGPADTSGGERGTLPSSAYRQITSILCAADYVWVFYRWPEKTSIQGQFDNSTFVMAARYNEDLEEEFIYRETDAELTASMAVAYGWSTPSGSIRTAFPFNDKRHYGVDGEGNVTFHMVGASTGGTQTRSGVRSFAPDGSLRWELPSATVPPGITLWPREEIAVSFDGSVWCMASFTPPISGPELLYCMKYSNSGVFQFAIPLTIPTGEEINVDGYQIVMQGSTPIVFSTRCNTLPLFSVAEREYKHRFWKVPSSGGGAVLTWSQTLTNSNKRLRNMTFPTADLRGSLGGQDAWVIEYDITSTDNERQVLRYGVTGTQKPSYSATVPTWFGQAYLPQSPGVGSIFYGGNAYNDCCDSDSTGKLVVVAGRNAGVTTFPQVGPVTPPDKPRLAQIDSSGNTEWVSDPLTRAEQPNGDPNVLASQLHLATSGNAIFVASDGQYW